MKKNAKLTMLLGTFVLMGISSLYAQNVKIDARMNVLASDTGNYLNWTKGSDTVSDKFDAATSASLKGSTAGLDAIRYDGAETKKAGIPVALRGLLLYPISDFGTTTADALTVTESGKVLVVRYVHRGTAYEITTDKSGKFDVLTGAKLAKGLADNVGGAFILKPEFIKAGGDVNKMSDLDWSKITLVADAKDAAATRWYEGKLALAYKSGVLTVKGSLTEKKAKAK